MNKEVDIVTEFEEVESGSEYWKSGEHDEGFTIEEGRKPFPHREVEYVVVEYHELDVPKRWDKAVMDAAGLGPDDISPA